MPLESVSVVGRHRTCSIVLSYDSVRRRHIKITKRGKAYSVTGTQPQYDDITLVVVRRKEE